MRYLLYIAALLFTLPAFSQPVNRIKLRQLQAASDTTSNYRILSNKDTAEWVLVGVDSIQYVTDTSALSPNVGDVFVNSTKDTMGVYRITGGWLLFYGGASGGGINNIVEDLTPQLGGELDALGNNITGLGDVTFQTGASGGTLRTGTSNADKFVLQAYDVNGGAYTTLMEADAGNEPYLQLIADYLRLEDATDITKIVTFDISGISAGASRSLAFQDSDGTIALTSDITIDSVYSITNVPDTTTLSPGVGDAFINTSADTLGLYSGTGWVLFYGGGGGSGTTDTYALITYIADGTDTIDFSSQRNGYFRLSLNSWAYRDSLTFTNPNSSIAPTYTLHIDSVDVDTIVFPSNLLDANRDALGSRRLIDGALLSFFYDGTNYIAPNPVGVPVTVPVWDYSGFDVTMSKTASNTSPTTGDTVTFYLAIENTSATTAATNLTIKDYLPDSLSNVHSISDSGTLNGTSDTITWSIANIAIGVIDTLSFAAQVDGNSTNYGEITAVDQTESNTANNIDSVVVSSSTPAGAVDTILANSSGLRLYLNADSLGLSDTDPVTTWADLSANSNDVTQATTAEKPTFVATAVNGRAAVSFDGGDILVSAGASWTSDSVTIFIVARADDETSGGVIAGRYNTGAGAREFQIAQVASSGLYRAVYSTDGINNGTTDSDSLITNNWSAYTITFTPSNIVLRKNGSVVPESSSSSGAIFDGATTYNIGGNMDGPTENPSFSGDIAIVVMYHRLLSSTEIAEIETYLNNQYSLW